MCGLVGMVGFMEHKHKSVMHDLLFLNTLRGKDSTGFTAVSRDRIVTTRKMTVPGYEFIEHPLFEKAMKHGDQLWMGHGRYKTTGEVSKANAHPFEVGNDDEVFLVGTHNGTLNNKFEIERKLDNRRFDTDSEALFNLLYESDNYKDAIKVLRGAWSLVWWNPAENNLHFLRNNERPLTFAYTKDKRVLIWASEAWMIVNAAKRNGVELATYSDKNMSCYSTLPDHLYTIHIPQERDKELPDFEREGGYTGLPTPTYNNNNGYDKFRSWWDEDKHEQKTTKAVSEKTTADGKKDEKQTFIIGTPPSDPPGSIRGFGGELISLQKFAAIKNKGCAWNKCKLDAGSIVAFISEDTVVCNKCMRDTHPEGRIKDEEDDDDVFLDDDLPLKLTDEGREKMAGLLETSVNQKNRKAG